MLVLSAADVAAVLTPADCMIAMERVFTGLARGEFYQPLRSRIRPEGSPNWLTLMPSLRYAGPPLWELKAMAVNPANSARGLDPIQGTVLLHDGDDGRLLAPETQVEHAETIAAAVRDADIICTTTASSAPILPDALIAPGTHINAIGSSAPTTREVEPATIARARFFVDRRESAISESGDYRRGAGGGFHPRA